MKYQSEDNESAAYRKGTPPNLFAEKIKPESTVLEFGPAMGGFTKYLTEQLKCKVSIVELDPEGAKSAMNYAVDGVVGDIDKFEWVDYYEGKKFDYILFGDVLEHLRYPQLVLEKCYSFLKEDGMVMMSIPNLAHNSILIALYNNEFRYTKFGLLDDTHIHLFTYYTLQELCKNARFCPIIEEATYARVGYNEISSSYQQIHPAMAAFIRGRDFGCVYQFVFTLQKESYVKEHGVEKQNLIIKNLVE